MPAGSGPSSKVSATTFSLVSTRFTRVPKNWKVRELATSQQRIPGSEHDDQHDRDRDRPLPCAAGFQDHAAHLGGGAGPREAAKVLSTKVMRGTFMALKAMGVPLTDPSERVEDAQGGGAERAADVLGR